MRPDGIRVKNQDPMYELMPFFLPRRYDAQNMITIDVPLAPMHTTSTASVRTGFVSVIWLWCCQLMCAPLRNILI